MRNSFGELLIRRTSVSAILLLPLAAALAQGPPVIPVGLDAYRQWDRWDYQRIGERAYMRSTYDRTGGNEGSDASHFLYQLSDSNNVTLDVAGAGIVYFVRYNYWHGSPWHYVVDGTDNVVQETTTANPTNPIYGSVFMPTNAFPTPMALTFATTQGADVSWVPIGFQNSFRMAYERTCYGTGYYIYHQFASLSNLSQPITSWNPQMTPSQDVLNLFAAAGTDISPTNGVTELDGSVGTLGANQTNMLLMLRDAPGTVRKLSFTVPASQAIAFGQSWLRVTWDGRSQPSINAPVALFFGAGTLYNRNNSQYLVQALPSYIKFTGSNAQLACFFPMPFFRSAQVELVGPAAGSVCGVSWTLTYQPLSDPPGSVGYFHATYCDHGVPTLGQDLVFLDTRQVEGGGDWSGSFVGTSFIFSDQADLGTLEGDPRFFFDDSHTPQAYGTGTEEWGCGGNYWGGNITTLPLAGHPTGAPSPALANNAQDLIESTYRFLLADLMPFGKNAVIRFEHGGNDDSTDHYQSVAYWYGAPAASLVKTDELKVGNATSEAAHNYVSPQAGAPYSITSRYEWGVDFWPSAAGSAPLASPTDYAGFQFQAQAGQPYYIWVRGENLDGTTTSDSDWFQFDQDIGTTNLGAYGGPYGFGNWGDQSEFNYFWSSGRPDPPDADPPLTVTFSQSGAHTLLVQPRQWQHHLEQIWLSAWQSNTPAPDVMPTNDAGDIVLPASSALVVSGAVQLVSDGDSALGTVLNMNSTDSDGTTFPAFTDCGRTTTGTSEFTLNLNSNNLGVLLRRKLDYSYPNQQAQVYVADGAQGEPAAGSWALAGTWYTAGANTCVFSDPSDELGATTQTVETSDRRFRDDEFLVPQNLTQGVSALRVQIQFTPVNVPLFPGYAMASQAWSEMQYQAYCYVIPNWQSSPQVYQEQAGQVVVEAQHFAFRTNSPANAWHFHVVPDDNGVDSWFDVPASPANGFLNSRTGQYLQILPGESMVNSSAVSAVNPPWVDYKVYLQTPGTYQLYLRWRGADSGSDSLYAQIVELGGAQIYSGDPGADFSNSWRGANGGTAWTVNLPGLYTIRVSCCQSGAALDTLCLQLAGLPAPAEPGPAESSVATNLPALLLTAQTPAPGQTNVFPTAPITAQVLDCVQPSDPSLFSLWLDGSQVAATVTKIGAVTTISYTPAQPAALGSAHSVEILYLDSSPLQVNWTNSWNFTVAGTVPPTITSSGCSGGMFSISWMGGGMLQSTTNLTPPVVWNDVTTNGTFTEPAVGAKFYRVVVEDN